MRFLIITDNLNLKWRVFIIFLKLVQFFFFFLFLRLMFWWLIFLFIFQFLFLTRAFYMCFWVRDLKFWDKIIKNDVHFWSFSSYLSCIDFLDTAFNFLRRIWFFFIKLWLKWFSCGKYWMGFIVLWVLYKIWILLFLFFDWNHWMDLTGFTVFYEIWFLFLSFLIR